jgi:hypothetical protein
MKMDKPDGVPETLGLIMLVWPIRNIQNLGWTEFELIKKSKIGFNDERILKSGEPRKVDYNSLDWKLR